MDWKGVLTYVFVIAIMAAGLISVVQLVFGA